MLFRSNTPASKVGLKAGDCIVEVNGAPIGSIGELGKELAKVDSGEVRIVVVREHQRIELRPQLEPRSENQFNWGYEGPGSWDTESFGNFDFEPSDFQVYVNPANLVVPNVVLPKIVVPKMKFKFPKIEIPKIEIPAIELPQIDLKEYEKEIELENSEFGLIY